MPASSFVPISMPKIPRHAAVTAGDQSLVTAQRETHEELGINVPTEVGEHMQPMMMTTFVCVSTLVHSISSHCTCKRHWTCLFHPVP